MAAFKVKNIWTVFLTAFFAVLASLGLTAPAAAAADVAQQPAEQPATAPEAANKVTEEHAARATAPRQLMPRDRSLPPTIKQRIRAEAHGSSPSVRHLPADLPADDDLVRDIDRDADHEIDRGPAAAAESALAAA